MVPMSPRNEQPLQPAGSSEFTAAVSSGSGGAAAASGGSALAPVPGLKVIKEGQVLKRGYCVPTKKNWNRRYFVLRGHVLSYWATREEYLGGAKPRGALTLAPDCSVGEIYISVRKGRKGGGGGKDEGGKDSDGYDDSGDETASEASEALLPPPPPPKEKSKRSAYASKAASKFRRKKEKEQLYCFKISWLETSSSKGTESTASGGSGSGGMPAIGETSPSFDNAGAGAATPGRRLSRDQATNSPRLMYLTDDEACLPGTELISEDVAAAAAAAGGPGTPRRRPSADHVRAAALAGRNAPAAAAAAAGRPPRSRTAGSAPGTPRAGSPLALPTLPPDSRSSPPSGGGGGGAASLPPRPSSGAGGGGGGGGGGDERTDANLGGGDVIAAPAAPCVPGSRSGEIDDNDDGSLSPPAAPHGKDGAAAAAAAGDEGIQKHYHELVSRQEKVSKERREEMMRVMFLASKKAARKRNTKRIVQGSKIAAATGAIATAGVLTAGVGLAVGLVFVGITAAAGGGGAMAEANYLRTKGKTSMMLACRSLEEAQAWKDALEAVIRDEVPAASEQAKDLWSALFARDGSTIPGAGARVRGGAAGHPGQGGQQKQNRGGAEGGDVGGGFDPEPVWLPLEGGWVLLLGCGAHGLRIFREERDAGAALSRALRRRRVSVEGGICPPLKAHVALSAAPLNAFMCLMSHGRTDKKRPAFVGGELDASVPVLTPNSGQRASFRIVETIDDHMDIIHLFFRPIYLFPSWTAPRDYVLFRYWRYDPDGSYMICLESVTHQDCPPLDGFVRGDLHGVYTIAPLKTSRLKKGGGGQEQGEQECLLTSLVQVDPKGWVPTVPLSPLSNQSYAEAFGVSALLQLLDVRDALDYDRFVPVSMDADARPLKRTWKVPGIDDKHSSSSLQASRALRQSQSRAAATNVPELQGSPSTDYEEEDLVNYDFAYSSREIPHGPDHVSAAATEPGIAAPATFSTFPEPLQPECWAEPDANSFRVRGKMYKTDRKKFNAGPSIMRLFATDIVETPENIMTGMCAHPRERVQQSLARGDLPPFVFCVNIALPGPPCFHMVFYYAIDDISAIDGTDGTPSSKLANSFFFGGDDEFRDKTFKLIPQIVEGNFMVRKAVGSTPCIMGTKLKQHHLVDPSPEPRYYELLLDTGSDPVAKGVIRLCLGYAKSIVVDMAFLLEGDDESTLPERVMGCARLKDMIFSGLRIVDVP